MTDSKVGVDFRTVPVLDEGSGEWTNNNRPKVRNTRQLASGGVKERLPGEEIPFVWYSRSLPYGLSIFTIRKYWFRVLIIV